MIGRTRSHASKGKLTMVDSTDGSLTFVGAGLYSTQDLTVQALDAISQADHVYFDTYTSILTGASIEEFSRQLNTTIIPLTRKEIEETPEKGILSVAKKQKVVLLVPGDPMISTTHLDLRIRAHKLGIPTKIIHGVSIQTAALSACGLENYKVGLSVTLPFFTENYTPQSPYFRILDNFQRGLHTLIYLDIQAKEKRYMSVSEGIEILLTLEAQIKRNLIAPDTLLVGLARVGSPSMKIEAGTPKKLQATEFGPPPHIIIFPGKLHFMEKKALETFANL